MDGTYDCLVIGGGPAGLSAAIYTGRFLRSTLVLDDAEGRSTYAQVNDNYLGFPNGIAIRELRSLGEQQAARFGVKFNRAMVNELACDGDQFVAHCSNGSFRGRTVILCTGVTDIWPKLPQIEEYVGRSLFWCITCDGFRTFNKRVVLFGHDEDAATTACQFNLYTKTITFVTAPGELDCSEARVKTMEEHGIEILEGKPESIEGGPEDPRAVVLDDGRRLPCDIMFSLLGCKPNVKLAVDVGADLTSKGYVRIDDDGYTTVPGLFCAGDVSGIHTHQVSSAVHEGAEAAQTANYYLYSAYQKLEFSTPEQDVKPRLELH